MVANLSSHKRGWDDRWEEYSDWAVKGKACHDELLRLVDEDTNAFNKIMTAFGLPESSDEEKAAKNKAIQDATVGATEVPFRTMEVAFQSMEVAEAMAHSGLEASVSDAGVAAVCARSAVMGAFLNVRINAAELKDHRVLVAWRGEPQARKYFSISTDGGMTLSPPAELKYDDGTRFYSPASYFRLIRNSVTGKLYWIGNITGKTQGTAPRYPLVIAEINESGTPSLKKSTVTVIDDKQPNQTSSVQFSGNLPGAPARYLSLTRSQLVRSLTGHSRNRGIDCPSLLISMVSPLRVTSTMLRSFSSITRSSTPRTESKAVSPIPITSPISSPWDSGRLSGGYSMRGTADLGRNTRCRQGFHRPKRLPCTRPAETPRPGCERSVSDSACLWG